MAAMTLSWAREVGGRRQVGSAGAGGCWGAETGQTEDSGTQGRKRRGGGGDWGAQTLQEWVGEDCSEGGHENASPTAAGIGDGGTGGGGIGVLPQLQSRSPSSRQRGGEHAAPRAGPRGGGPGEREAAAQGGEERRAAAPRPAPAAPALAPPWVGTRWAPAAPAPVPLWRLRTRAARHLRYPWAAPVPLGGSGAPAQDRGEGGSGRSQLPPRGFWLRLVAHTAPSSTHPAWLPAGTAGVWDAPPGSTRGGSGWQCQVSAGNFPSLSPSCHCARGLLKNLFHSSRHRGGNDGWCLWPHLSSQGWGTVSPLPARSRLQGGARELLSLEMEMRHWSSQHPCRIFGSIPQSISVHSRRHKVNLAVYQTQCPQNAAVPRQDPMPRIVEGTLGKEPVNRQSESVSHSDREGNKCTRRICSMRWVMGMNPASPSDGEQLEDRCCPVEPAIPGRGGYSTDRTVSRQAIKRTSSPLSTKSIP
ncbi:uncharacterized protein LOC141963297 [Athene noctua]|uniref:uncharacterized protein LOC141963297 n=1 Tax=Athene noctua TaxID=126797 RepID=UPI003EB69A95